MWKKLVEMLLTSLMNLFLVKDLNPKLWVFSSSYNRKFNYNARYLFDYVFEHLQHTHGVTPLFVINDAPLRERLNQEYRERYEELFGRAAVQDFFVPSGSWAGKRALLHAGVWFTSAGLPVYQGLRKRDRLVINLWHGVPLKKIALCEAGATRVQKLFFRLVFSRNYTHVVTTSAQLVPIMSKSFAVPEQRVVIWGQPRNDVLLRSLAASTEFDLRAVYAARGQTLPDYQCVVLYAPTYRDTTATWLFPFADFDGAALDAFLNEHGILILLRCHQSERASVQGLSSRIIEFGSDIQADINAALPAFDALVTDYSSIYIDYLLLDRPLIFLPYDKDDYLATRGLNFDYDAVTPGPKPERMGDFIAQLKWCATRELNAAQHAPKDRYAVQRREVNQLLNGSAQLSCPRIAREIIEL